VGMAKSIGESAAGSMTNVTCGLSASLETGHSPAVLRYLGLRTVSLPSVGGLA